MDDTKATTTKHNCQSIFTRKQITKSIRIAHAHDTHAQVTLGLGFRINFPVSSQDILKSTRTERVRVVIIDGATTRLWMPIRNSRISMALETVKNG